MFAPVLAWLRPCSLSQEVLDFEQYVYYAQRSWDVGINRVVEDIRGIVNRIWRDATVEAFGSFASGLWLPNSDVDLVIKVKMIACDLIPSWFRCIGLASRCRAPALCVGAVNYPMSREGAPPQLHHTLPVCSTAGNILASLVVYIRLSCIWSAGHEQGSGQGCVVGGWWLRGNRDSCWPLRVCCWCWQRGLGKRRPVASPVACLYRLTKHLKKATYVTSLKLIDTAKVPVLKLAMDSDGVLFNVDITVDGQTTPHSGLMAWCVTVVARHTHHTSILLSSQLITFCNCGSRLMALMLRDSVAVVMSPSVTVFLSCLCAAAKW